MSHFALICPPFYSHIRLFEAVGEELARRGHRATFVLNGGAAGMVEAEGRGLAAVDVRERPREELDRIVARAAKGGGPIAVLRTVKDSAALTDELCRQAPALLDRLGVDAVIGDQMEPAAGLIAAHLGLPLVSLASALPIHDDPSVPLPFLSWPYDPSEKGLKRNRGGEKVARLLLTRQRRTIAAWSKRFGLARRDSLADCLSEVCQISQMVPSFDFPRAPSPIRHAVGPIRRRDRGAAPIALRRPGRRPLVFASFGTLQGHRADLFGKVASACRTLGVDCLVAHCGALGAKEAGRIGATFVTDFAPQRTILAQASVCVTHAGLNTVLDSLEAGVPMLAIPMAFDQPGIAARIVYHGVGERVPRVALSEAKIRACLERLLTEARFRDGARTIGRDIENSGGAALAADIVERVVLTDGRLSGGEQPA
ncbi:glycosyltransferase [Aurantimonas sp. VKM B-3413]|uniref:glycosyltransferase n=1 Tax=Aurantimonas sp. VKM B-3413 TaxID=2779401 RepID=UPI001E5D67DF|nr:glycosyltransferase [Aurantimonas sp. VKM B-3413]MCB8838728.1 glycosyltransferase [Aurantimonas sp. VKM B-3413]